MATSETEHPPSGAPGVGPQQPLVNSARLTQRVSGRRHGGVNPCCERKRETSQRRPRGQRGSQSLNLLEMLTCLFVRKWDGQISGCFLK